ncbi:hypothetical protein [Salipiger aestuarii]|uniref:Uncharacterized protein n=1 Tax=Salipiger aestuarii TaxID=568098 RepID=A0A327YL92_9RHOB|nr:hypothetical protein [Salipiger aestuarii]KAA8613074.1 hypothetical protein AL037_06060 [Salipiger aestuarii]KAB2542544.1 hypothetical protein AL035_06535 [Salipiger aestuarii]RAK19019.1 hypothetical protein ATI53_101061 [Salipiger aestuarii]
MKFLVVLLSAVTAGVAADADTKLATCEIDVEASFALTSGRCYFKPLENGDFVFEMLDGTGGAIARDITTGPVSLAPANQNSGEGRGVDYSMGQFWTNLPGEGFDMVRMGSLYRGGESRRSGCWGNRNYEICAW